MNTPKERKSQVTIQSKVSEETLLKISKEIVVKFIEVGKVSPANFETAFDQVYKTIEKRVQARSDD